MSNVHVFDHPLIQQKKVISKHEIEEIIAKIARIPPKTTTMAKSGKFMNSRKKKSLLFFMKQGKL